MLRTALFVAAMVALSLAGPALAQTVLGIELGKPLNYPQCSLDPTAPPPNNQPCLQGISGFVLGKELPSYANTLHPVVENGVVVSIEIITNGAAAEEAAYKGLLEKFGPPNKHHVTQMQNGFGAKFENIEAMWQKSTFTVMFEGIAGDSESGVIDIATPAYAKKLIDMSTNKTTL